MAPSLRSFSSKATALDSLIGTLSRRRLPVDLPVDLAVLQRPLEAENGIRQRLVDQRAARNAGVEGDADQPVAALGMALGGQACRTARSDSSARSFSARSKSKSAVPVANVPLAVADVWSLKMRNCRATIPVLPRASPPVMRVSPASRLSTASLPIAEPRCEAVDRQVERAVDRLDRTGSVQVEGAGQFASGQLREWRDAGGLDLDVAVECRVGDVACERNAEAVARQQRLGEPQRCAGGPVAVDVEIDLLAERLGDIGPHGRDACRRAHQRKADVPLGGDRQVLRRRRPSSARPGSMRTYPSRADPA